MSERPPHNGRNKLPGTLLAEKDPGSAMRGDARAKGVTTKSAIRARAVATTGTRRVGEEQQQLADRTAQHRSYRSIIADMLELTQRFPGWATVLDYGYTPGGRTLRMLRLSDPGAANIIDRPAALITGATHGDEFLAIEDRLASSLLERRAQSSGLARFFAMGGIVYIVPIVNPDGYDRDSRTNNRNIDLNRDFPIPGEVDSGLREPESRALTEILDRDLEASQAKLRITVDYHCCKASLLYPWSHGESNLPADVLAAHERVAQLMQTIIDPSYAMGTTADLLGYTARGTSKDYFHARYGSLAFTFEGRRKEEASKLNKHAQFWDTMLATLAE